MLRIRLSSVILLTVFLAGCAGSYHVVQIPQREADLYPLSQTKGGITIAIDEIKNPARAERYFGADLINEGILPVTVVVSNYGEHRVVVKPSDIVLHRGKEMIDPLPIEIVLAAVKGQGGYRSKTEEQIDRFFEGMVFTERVLPPNETYQGVMFFSIPREEETGNTFFTALSVFREGGARIRVGVTNLDSHSRMHFGPFSISLPQETPLFWQ